VAEKVFVRLWTQEQDKLKVILAASADIGDLGGLRRTLWEQYVHHWLAEGGVFKIRDLEEPGAKQLELEIEPSVPAVLNQWPSLKDQKDGVYCRPQKKGNEAVDSAMQPDKLF
jgi:hypothetical protein